MILNICYLGRVMCKVGRKDSEERNRECWTLLLYMENALFTEGDQHCNYCQSTILLQMLMKREQ